MEFEALFFLIDLGYDLGVPQNRVSRRRKSCVLRNLSKHMIPCFISDINDIDRGKIHLPEKRDPGRPARPARPH
jgi:hypothetical protein